MATKCPLVPIGRIVVIEKLEAEEKSPGGIYLPDIAREKPQLGRIAALGRLAFRVADGAAAATVSPEPVGDVGSLVVLQAYSGTEVKYGGKAWFLVKDEDILAVVQD